MASQAHTHAALVARKKARKRRAPDESTLLDVPEPALVLSGPEMRQPSNVIALQRAFGNQTALKMLQRAPLTQTVQREGKDDEDQNGGNDNNDIENSLEQAKENQEENDDQNGTNPNEAEVDPAQGLGGNVPEEDGNMSGVSGIKLGGSVAPATNAPKFRSNKAGKLKSQDYKFGAYRGYKTGKKIKGGITGIIDNVDTVNDIRAQTPVEYGQTFVSASETVANAAGSGSVLAIQGALSGFVGVFMPYLKLIKLAVKVITGIRKTDKTRQNMSALKSSFKASKEKAAEGDAVAQVVYESAKYGFRKVRRQFAERIAKIIVAIIKFATIITDLVTGGTAILFTSASKLLTGVTTGVMTGIAAAKSIYKTFKRTKGVNRNLNSEKLITAANGGNVEALHLLYKMKVGKQLWMKQQGLKKSKNPFAKEIDFFKKNEEGYRAWLMALDSKEWGRLRGELARKLRSTTAKTFTEKRRAMGV